MAQAPTRWQSARRLHVRPLFKEPRVHANTFAARAGRWSAQHRKTAIWGWIAFVAVAFIIGGALGAEKPTDYIGPRDPPRAAPLAGDHFPHGASPNGMIHAPTGGSANETPRRTAGA